MTNEVLTREQKRWAYERWCEGRTLAEVGDALGVCSKTIQRAIDGKPRIKPVLVYTDGKRKA